MSANEYTAGDLVEAVKGTTVIRGTLVNSFGLGRSLCLKLTLGIETDIIHLEANGYTITVIEKAAPVVVLPTEQGAYRDASGKYWNLDGRGYWYGFYGSFGPISDAVQDNLPLRRLEPVSETAKKVLERVRILRDDAQEYDLSGASTRDMLRELINVLAIEFGVER